MKKNKTWFLIVFGASLISLESRNILSLFAQRIRPPAIDQYLSPRENPSPAMEIAARKLYLSLQGKNISIFRLELAMRVGSDLGSTYNYSHFGRLSRKLNLCPGCRIVSLNPKGQYVMLYYQSLHRLERLEKEYQVMKKTQAKLAGRNSHSPREALSLKPRPRLLDSLTIKTSEMEADKKLLLETLCLLEMTLFENRWAIPNPTGEMATELIPNTDYQIIL
ncbi:MAG: hypothetical protein HY399_07320 [Elusimicrobia bacterium]|nr:hypothetical protein [Elusimicrobiota bacterium]